MDYSALRILRRVLYRKKSKGIFHMIRGLWRTIQHTLEADRQSVTAYTIEQHIKRAHSKNHVSVLTKSQLLPRESCCCSVLRWLLDCHPPSLPSFPRPRFVERNPYMRFFFARFFSLARSLSKCLDTTTHPSAYFYTHASAHALAHTPAHALTHASAHARAHASAHILAHASAHALTHAPAHARAHASAHVLAHALTHVLAHARAHVLAHASAHVLTDTSAHVLADVPTHAHTHFLTYARTYTSAYVLTHAHTCASGHDHAHDNLDADIGD